MNDHNTHQRKAWLSAMQHGKPSAHTVWRDIVAAILGALALLAALWV
jgi:hypothetical protein